MQYYGIDWAIFFLLTTHTILLGYKWRPTFLIAAVSCCLGIWLAYLIGSFPSGMMNTIFVILNVRNYFLWVDKK